MQIYLSVDIELTFKHSHHQFTHPWPIADWNIRFWSTHTKCSNEFHSSIYSIIIFSIGSSAISNQHRLSFFFVPLTHHAMRWAREKNFPKKIAVIFCPHLSVIYSRSISKASAKKRLHRSNADPKWQSHASLLEFFFCFCLHVCAYIHGTWHMRKCCCNGCSDCRLCCGKKATSCHVKLKLFCFRVCFNMLCVCVCCRSWRQQHALFIMVNTHIECNRIIFTGEKILKFIMILTVTYLLGRRRVCVCTFDERPFIMLAAGHYGNVVIVVIGGDVNTIILFRFQ